MQRRQGFESPAWEQFAVCPLGHTLKILNFDWVLDDMNLLMSFTMLENEQSPSISYVVCWMPPPAFFTSQMFSLTGCTASIFLSDSCIVLASSVFGKNMTSAS